MRMCLSWSNTISYRTKGHAARLTHFGIAVPSAAALVRLMSTTVRVGRLTDYVEAAIEPFLRNFPDKLFVGGNRMQPVEQVMLGGVLLDRLGVVHTELEEV